MLVSDFLCEARSSRGTGIGGTCEKPGTVTWRTHSCVPAPESMTISARLTVPSIFHASRELPTDGPYLVDHGGETNSRFRELFFTYGGCLCKIVALECFRTARG